MNSVRANYDFVIIGGGVIGLCTARELRLLHPNISILLIEKEEAIAAHASGRNSGVLHAGFYYTADSLKAKFTKEGNAAWTEYCIDRKLPINQCGKIVVANNDIDDAGLKELKKRGDANGIKLYWIDQKEAFELDPAAKVEKRALWSPTTSSVDPMQVCNSVRQELLQSGVQILIGAKYISIKTNHSNAKKISIPSYTEDISPSNIHTNDFSKPSHTIITSKGIFEAGFVINCAGLYADKIAHDFGFGLNYTLLPFKGLYLKTDSVYTGIKRHIYPVPNLTNPFLGVHFTITVDGRVKIGPTAIPGFWREHYQGLDRFNIPELLEILGLESKLFLSNKWGFRNLAIEEIRKYSNPYMYKLAAALVHKFNPADFTHKAPVGIRAQLLDKQTGKLVQDFIVEGDKKSLHFLNSVSPAFTCALPFVKWVLSNQL